MSLTIHFAESAGCPQFEPFTTNSQQREQHSSKETACDSKCGSLIKRYARRFSKGLKQQNHWSAYFSWFTCITNILCNTHIL